MLLDHTVYMQRDNTIQLLLAEGDSLYTEIYPTYPPTRFILKAGSVTIDSRTASGIFTWYPVTSILSMKLGRYTTNPNFADLGTVHASLRVYSAIWPNGVIWIDTENTPDILRLTIVP